jgi:CRP-like cAMP-binding protein
MNNPLVDYLTLLKPIAPEDKARIAAAWEIRSYKEGDYLFRAGHVCRERFFICNGVLRIVKTNEKGVENTHFFLRENQFCTILNSFNREEPADENIQAACDATVQAISKKALTALYAQIPYLQSLIDQITQQALLDKVEIRNTYLGYDSATRYKLFLIRQPDIALRVPMRDIASYLGITPQSLSRIRKHMK